MDIRRIAFGYISAEDERSRDPGLLLEGHLDFKAASEEALRGDKFLFLGYKGSGKSSIAERLRLQLDHTFDRFLSLVSLADFPFTPFSKMIRGDTEPEAKYPSAWSWILLIYLLESFHKDQGATFLDKSTFEDAIVAFRNMGLSPASAPGSIVRTTARQGFKLSLPGKWAEYSWSGADTKSASDIPDFVESLKTLFQSVRSTSRHYLIIDGLDDILTTREVQYRSLSALIFEVSRLNRMFVQHDVPAKIILLCRTDLFERVPGTNKNKVRQDSAVELDWYHDPRAPDQSMLLKIADIRTTRSLGYGTKLFDDLLPSHIDSKGIKQTLLDMTRHTPRDFLRLLSHIQEFASSGRCTSDQVKSGLREYSIKYFLPEIQDELSGYAASEDIQQVLTALGRVGKREFRLNEITAECGALAKPVAKDKVFEIFQQLFQCGAVGNVQGRMTGTTFYSFKFRNRHSSFNENETILLHRGLWKALNLI